MTAQQGFSAFFATAAVCFLAACNHSQATEDLLSGDLGAADFSLATDLFDASAFCGTDPFCHDAMYRSTAKRPDANPIPTTGILDGTAIDSSGAVILSHDRSLGTYSLIVPGFRCNDMAATAWLGVWWSAVTPDGSSVTVRARTADSPEQGAPAWSSAIYTASASVAPLDLTPPALVPNALRENVGMTPVLNGYLWVEFAFRRAQTGAGPILFGLDVLFESSFCDG